MLYATQKKHRLLDHLFALSRLAAAMAEKIGLSKVFVRAIAVAGLLADIGMASDLYQEGLKSFFDKKEKGNFDEDPDKPQHQEVSWAFLAQKFSYDDGWEDTPGKILSYEKLLNSIYNHHPSPMLSDEESRNTSESILGHKDFGRKNIKNIERVYKKLKRFLPDLKERTINRDTEIPPLYFKDASADRNDNAEIISMVACIISAGHYIEKVDAETVRSISKSKKVRDDIIKELTKGNVGPYKNPTGHFKTYKDQARFDSQVKIASTAAQYRTVVIKGPTGFGKTLIGLLWGSKLNGKLIWVCPRNSVALAMYNLISKTVGDLRMNCSVELYLTSERKDCNFSDKEIPPFGSDIVITNIDNLLSPMVSERISDRLFLILSANIMFDEFPEFVGEEPQFAAFIALIRARCRLSIQANTGFLSASPMDLWRLWDNSSHNTVVLPNESEHYPAVHSRAHQITTGKLPKKLIAGSATVFNSVKNVQDIANKKGADFIAHSKYTAEDLRNNINGLISSYGPEGDGISSGKTLVSGPIIQSALDISLDDILDNMCSPEKFLQIQGRLDRWPNKRSNKEATFRIILGYEGDLSENAAINTVYSSKLKKIWWEFLKEKIKENPLWTTDQTHALYNEFYKQHGDEVYNWVRMQYIKSSQNLNEFQALHGTETTQSQLNKKMMSARTLRNPTGSYYFTVRNKEGAWIPPDQVFSGGADLYHRYTSNAYLNKYLLRPNLMEKTLKSLINSGYVGYEKIIKRRRIPKTLPAWFKLARNKSTPIPDISHIYHPIMNGKGLGLVSKI